MDTELGSETYHERWRFTISFFEHSSRPYKVTKLDSEKTTTARFKTLTEAVAWIQLHV